MDEQQQRLLEDLSGSLEGDIACDIGTLSIYSTDASLCAITPTAVAFPKTTDDVAALAAYSEEEQIPLTPRGAGTGLAGGALGTGIIVDFARYMNRIISVGPDTVEVQPGIVLDELNRQLALSGRYFAPDPSNSAVTTVGGMIGVDAAGSHAVRVGSTRDHVKSLEMVVSGGARLSVGHESLDRIRLTGDFPEAVRDVIDHATPADNGNKPSRAIISKLMKLLGDHEELIALNQPPLPRNCAGYYLRGVRTKHDLNLPRLIVGSEGTLGMVTSAVLHTLPLPDHRGVVLFEFGEMADALKAIGTIGEHQPSACDLLDRRILSLAREDNPRYAELISQHVEAVVIVEQVGADEMQMKRRLAEIVQSVRLTCPTSNVIFTSDDEQGVDFVWGLARKVTSLLSRLKGSTVPLPFVEDIAVPPKSLADFLPRAQRVFQMHQVTSSLYTHAASGQIHLRPFMPDYHADDGEKLEALARDLYRVVFEFGGTLSGEHGDGLTRTSFLRSQYGPLYRVFKLVKDVFDPHNLMNPGKIVSDDPHLLRRHLRPTPQPETVTELQLTWSANELHTAANDCNSCGSCRTQSDDLRMCPFFEVDQREAASPRAKASVIQNFVAGQLGSADLASDEINEVASLCFNCKQCESECPTNVNIPHFFTELKANYVAVNGASWADWLLARTHLVGKIGTRFSLLVNPLLTNRLSRWLLEKIFGISRYRKLPRFASYTFMNFAERQQRRSKREHPNDGDVIYFVDQFANLHDPQIGTAVTSIVKRLGSGIFVPANQNISGMAFITSGEVEAAKAIADNNIRELAEYAREGHDIITTEPSANLCLKQEYAMVVENPEIPVVANRAIDFGKFLEQRLEGGTDFDFRPVPLKIGYHVPCHVKSIYGDSPYIKVLEAIPELEIVRLNDGCSGMAGMFGLKKENHETSQTIGKPLFDSMQREPIHLGCTECSSCKMQMEFGTGQTIIHPAKLIAYAMGTPVKAISELRGFPKLK